MKILFVYPEFPDTFWSFKHALKFIRKKAAAPPLGLLTVASLLPTGWEKRLVDLNAENLKSGDLAWADMVFLSAMVVQRDSAREVIARCKAAGVKVVAGGPLFTQEHEQFPDVDHFVLNEAELTLPPFLADLALGRAQRIYATHEYPDLRLTPAPRWELANLKLYSTMSIQFSRGCPYNCDFCNVTALLGHRPRTKTASQITAELDGLYALGWRQNVFFVDDNFIGNKKQLKEEILPALIGWRKGKTGMPFNTEVSINLADDPELLRLMVEAGFDTVFIGIETPNEDSLAECGKYQNKNRILEDHLHLAAHPAQRLALERRQLVRLVIGRRKENLARRRAVELQDRAACGGFAAARLAHQPQRLAASDIKADTIHGFDAADLFHKDDALRDRKVFFEILHSKQNIVVAHCVFSRRVSTQQAFQWPGLTDSRGGFSL